MTPEEFLRAALGAGAQVRYIDGEMLVFPGTEVTITPRVPEIVAPPQKQKATKDRLPFADRAAGKHYRQFRETYGETNASVVASAVGLLIGHRYGRWNPSAEDILLESDKVDLATIQACGRSAVLIEHSVNRNRKQRASLSTSAVCASMYAAIDAEPALDLQDVIELLKTNSFKRVLLELDRSKSDLGGPRSHNFRRESLNRFLAVMLGKEV